MERCECTPERLCPQHYWRALSGQIRRATQAYEQRKDAMRYKEPQHVLDDA